jgi:hypothetical protein
MGARDGNVHPAFVLRSGEARCQLSGYVNFYRNWLPTLICEVPVGEVKVGVWCATGATSICGLIVDSINSGRYVTF